MVVNEEALWEHMERPLAERLIVTPLLSRDQLRGGSVDVRLGQEFILMKRSYKAPIDPLLMEQDPEDYQERVRVPVGDKMILHPNQLVLGATLEFLQVPADLMAYVIGRSSWGRLGLIVATAIMVSPGYRGSLTLELANLGDTPVYLYPGTRIAQLVFHTLTEAGGRYPQEGGKYTGPVGPEFSKLSLDQDWAVIRAFHQQRG